MCLFYFKLYVCAIWWRWRTSTVVDAQNRNCCVSGCAHGLLEVCRWRRGRLVELTESVQVRPCVCVIQPAHIHRETKPSVLLKAETYTVRQTDMWRNRIERGEWCSLLVADGRGSDTLLLLTTQSTLTEYKTYRPLLISQGAELLHWTNGWNLSCRKGALEKKVEDAVSIKMLSLLFSWAH